MKTTEYPGDALRASLSAAGSEAAVPALFIVVLVVIAILLQLKCSYTIHYVAISKCLVYKSSHQSILAYSYTFINMVF